MNDIYSDVIITGDCNYCDLTSACDLSDSIIHINIRSLAPKISELEILLNLLKYPKVLLISQITLPLLMLMVTAQFPHQYVQGMVEILQHMCAILFYFLLKINH
jgi:hypothetical protein